MALIRCPDCGRDISDAALACPHCARPMRMTAIHARGSAAAPRVILGQNTGGKPWVIAAAGVAVALMVSMCVGLAPDASAPSEPAFLEAHVQHTGPKIVVTNNGASTWSDCRVRLNDAWEYNAANIYPGQPLQIGIMMFTDDRGQRFNPVTHTPKEIYIRCASPGRSYRGGWK